MINDEGEFYPEKNLDKNYKIPKKDSGSNTEAKSHLESMETPLANSYYNYSYDPMAIAYYQNCQPMHYGDQGVQLFADPSLPKGLKRPADVLGEKALAQTIFNALDTVKEKPKNYKHNIFEQTVPDILDDSLPKELKLQFQPLYCKLCAVQLSSNQTAKLHYKSKNHEKKIRKWLTEWSERTGEPLHRRAMIVGEKKSEESEKNPQWFYCEVCDLQLTGKLHSESHYMGKNHQMAILGRKNPSGPGHYDKEGKWIRTKNAKAKMFSFENGEDNFGNDFKKATDEVLEEGPPPAKKKKEPPVFHCAICNINTNCQEQLDSHYRGQKHLKKLKQVSTYNPDSAAPIIELSPKEEAPPTDLSTFRTPSGDYYCSVCNITTNSIPQIIQHLSSKGHGKKSAQKN